MIFSVVMCVHEDNPYLDKAIKSILDQNYEDDFEFIIVANNCKNELFEKIKNYQDSRIKLFRTSIGQLSFNLNYAIDKAVGKYIIRMDSDDISYPNRLNDCCKYLDYDVVAFSANYIDEYDKKIKLFDVSSNNIGNIFYKNPIIHPAVMIRKTILLENRGYLGGYQSEDYDLWLRLARNNNIKFFFSEEVVLGYRINDGQSRGSNLPYCEVSGYMIRDFYLNFKFKYLLGFLIFSIKTILNKLR